MKPIKTSLFRAPRLALAMSSLFALPVLAVDPATVLPDESVGYLEMDTQALYKLKSHPVAKTLPLEKLEEMILKMTQSSKEDNEKIKKQLSEELGMSYEELEKKVGRFAMSIHDLKIPANPQPDNVGGEMSMAAEFDADEAFIEKYIKAMFKIIGEQMAKQGKASGAPDFDEMLKKVEEVMEHSTVEHGGAKIHVWKLKETDETKNAPKFVREWAYAIHEKMLLFSSGQDGVEEMIDRLKGGGGTGSLASSSLYKKDHDKAGKTILLASLNLETVLGLVEKHALSEIPSSDVDVKKVWTALGADKLQSAVFAAATGEDNLEVITLLTYSEKPGLFTIPAFPGAGTPPAFIPKGIASGGYGQIDLEKTLDNLTKVAGEVDARAGTAIQMGLGMVQGQVGIDIKKDILAQLGPDYWTAQATGEKSAGGSPGGGGESAAMMAMMGKTVMGFKVKDHKAFGGSLDTIFNKVGGKDALFEAREYQGYTINEVKQSPAEFRVGYVLTEDWFILSVAGGDVLEKILGNLKKGGDDGLFTQKVVSKTLDSMRGGQVMASATDLGESLSSLFSLLDVAMKQSGAGGSGAPEIPFDELAKLFNVPLLSVDKAWIDGSHAEYRMKLVPKGE